MQPGNLLLAALVFGVCTALAWGGSRRAQVLLFASALLVSSLLFLPVGRLIDAVGVETVVRLEALAARTPWSLPGWMHLFIFAGLGVVLWSCRPDLRGWKAWGVLVFLAAAAEFAQDLVAGRHARPEDVLLNLAGGTIGIFAAMLLQALARHLPDEKGPV